MGQRIIWDYDDIPHEGLPFNSSQHLFSREEKIHWDIGTPPFDLYPSINTKDLPPPWFGFSVDFYFTENFHLLKPNCIFGVLPWFSSSAQTATKRIRSIRLRECWINSIKIRNPKHVMMQCIGHPRIWWRYDEETNSLWAKGNLIGNSGHGQSQVFIGSYKKVFLAPKELYTWYCPMTIRQQPLFEHTPVLNNNFEYWCRDDFVDCDFYEE